MEQDSVNVKTDNTACYESKVNYGITLNKLKKFDFNLTSANVD